MPKTSVSSFDAARIKCLKAYAVLERELCFLMGALLGIDHDMARVVFYSISNTRARYKIIESALAIRHPDTFKKSWPKIEKWLGARDTARNHIIHWGQDERVVFVAEQVGEGKEVLFKREESEELSNNARRGIGDAENELRYDEAKLIEEARLLNEARIVVIRYRACIAQPGQWPWPERFQQPIGDQTLTQFLQSLNRVEPQPPPQSSPK